MMMMMMFVFLSGKKWQRKQNLDMVNLIYSGKIRGLKYHSQQCFDFENDRSRLGEKSWLPSIYPDMLCFQIVECRLLYVSKTKVKG